MHYLSFETTIYSSVQKIQEKLKAQKTTTTPVVLFDSSTHRRKLHVVIFCDDTGASPWAKLSIEGVTIARWVATGGNVNDFDNLPENTRIEIDLVLEPNNTLKFTQQNGTNASEGHIITYTETPSDFLSLNSIALDEMISKRTKELEKNNDEETDDEESDDEIEDSDGA